LINQPHFYVLWPTGITLDGGYTGRSPQNPDKMMKRREFVGGLAAAAGLTACAQEQADCSTSAATSGATFEWSLVTSWSKKLPGIGMAPENLATRIEAASGGRLKIKVYAGGEIVPPLEVFDAVSRGTVEMGHTASYYHKGKVDAAQFFTAIPFGLTKCKWADGSTRK
jgi:TRAP-type mannitol/chloroaromatic compound transport system substrate-binding protein